MLHSLFEPDSQEIVLAPPLVMLTALLNDAVIAPKIPSVPPDLSVTAS